MYTNLKNVQIVISLLKQFNIKRIVISPGSRNVPFVHSIESDPFFMCYSIVDERSAAFLATGMALNTKEIVVCTCTSSTASANYLPGVIEARRGNAKIIALTFDRDYRKLYKMEDQMINQVNMYGKYVVDSTNIPIIRDYMDEWYETTEVNRVIWNTINKGGPSQMNIQIDDFGTFNCEDLPVARKINICSQKEFIKYEQKYIDFLKSKKKIMVYCCQSFDQSDVIKDLLLDFQKKYNAIISYDEFSVAKSEEFIKTCRVTESMYLEEFEALCPDLVITIGGHSWSFMKYKLRHLHEKFDHWHIDSNGEIKDSFNSLTCVFKMNEEFFFKGVNNYSGVSDHEYYQMWKRRLEKVVMPELGYSNFGIIKKLAERIPNGSIVHLSVLNSIRLYNFVGGGDECSVYANLGTDGIDGCLSTYIGQSKNSGKLSFLIIGDLSSLYDCSAFQYLNSKNQRVLILNNHVGSEFYNNFGSYINTVDDYIGASHNNSLQGMSKLSDIQYLKAENMSEFESGLKVFLSESEKPIVFEVFTDPNIDTKVLGEYYRNNLYSDIGIKIKKIVKKLHLIK